MVGWPTTLDELIATQRSLSAMTPLPWRPPTGPLAIGGVWFTAPRGSSGDRPGEPAWAAAAVVGERTEDAVARGVTGAGYVAGSLAMREGPLLETAVAALDEPPDVLLVNATGRDHPLRAGLALHLGAVLDVPTIGVTNRPLLASGLEPGTERWAVSELRLEGVVVGAWLRTQAGSRSIVVHPAWQTSLETALTLVRRSIGSARTPEPLRRARRSARLGRAR
jgi:deoxyribonuclease V